MTRLARFLRWLTADPSDPLTDPVITWYAVTGQGVEVRHRVDYGLLERILKAKEGVWTT